jgi:antitoxin component HigA of HigAB toxin-antitoxin module
MSENNVIMKRHFEKIDSTAAKILGMLSRDLELGLEDNLMVALKVLLYLLHVVEQKATTKEEKEAVRKVKTRIAEYVLTGE